MMWGDYGTPGVFGPVAAAHGHDAGVPRPESRTSSPGRLQTTGFYGDNVQGFQRDAIAPDGTSGYYFLSHRPLVYGSESVFFELEDLNRPGTVLERTAAAARRGLRD